MIRNLAVKRFAVIMAGGRGERFWPLSRARRPKQLMPLPGGGTLLERTVRRLPPLIPHADVRVITARDLASGTRQALPLLWPEQILEEPQGRNTAACVALAALLLEWREPGCAFAALPADHHIGDEAAFRRALATGFDAAAGGTLVTFGIPPAHPATAYGYIRPSGSGAVRPVARFREKPDAATASQLLAEGGWYWNSGIFVWTARAILEELRRHAPEIHGPIAALEPLLGTSAFAEALERAYREIPALPIDRAVLERTDRAVMIEATFPWDDIGAWDAFLRNFPPSDGAALIDSPGAAVFGTGPDHLVAVVGLPDVVVVHTPDATLVLPRGRAEEVRRVVGHLSSLGREDLL